MLTDMVKLVARLPINGNESEYDDEYLRAALPILEREYDFWMQHGPCGHAVELTKRNESAGDTDRATYILNRYTSNANYPRPESYREDVLIAAEIFDRTMQREDGNAAATERYKDKYYNNVIAAAESGWDFSSRWLRDPLDMKSMVTSSVVPVELNSIMYRVECNLMEFNRHLSNEDRAQFFERAAARRLEAIDAILWSEKHHSWKDYDLETDSHSATVSVSDYTPLWAKAFNSSDIDRLKHVVTSLKSSGLLQVGGVQTTTIFSGQQWDSPNAWPPEQDIVVEGLLAVNTTESHSLARELSQTWMQASLTAWKQTGLMFEKYNASEVGGLGAGVGRGRRRSGKDVRLRVAEGRHVPDRVRVELVLHQRSPQAINELQHAPDGEAGAVVRVVGVPDGQHVLLRADGHGDADDVELLEGLADRGEDQVLPHLTQHVGLLLDLEDPAAALRERLPHRGAVGLVPEQVQVHVAVQLRRTLHVDVVAAASSNNKNNSKISTT
ncbi:hypothetical protein ON010_g8761 [Phytophthora cinnamomi]|nr:hypothetical protein ON010_g8761 [Phytophthora cinnamomi]